MSRQLHSEHFDVCRMCLRHPETNRNINFLDLYKPLHGGKTLKEYLKDLFDIIVEPNDQKPRIICEICYLKIVKIKEKKEKAAEPRVIMRSLYSKKPSLGQGSASLNASFDAINYDQIMDKPEFLSNAFSNSKENSEFISSSNQIKKHKKLRKGIVCKKITYEDESNDPNEPRYCLCDRVAFGSMVACDNKKCSHEWFHFECVGITTKPHGKWYCPKCFVKLKRKI